MRKVSKSAVNQRGFCIAAIVLRINLQAAISKRAEAGPACLSPHSSAEEIFGSSSGNFQFLADLNFVGIADVVRLGNLGVLVGSAVKGLADIGKIVAGLDDVESARANCNIV